MNRQNKIHITAAVCMLFMLAIGCEKFVEVDPPNNQVSSDAVFSGDGTADNAVNGIYAEMNNNSLQFTDGQTTILCGLAADELYNYFPGLDQEFYENQISIANHSGLTARFWYPAYRYIYTANLALEKLSNSSGVGNDTRIRLEGECKFLRAYCYFHLVNIFGDVPLILSSAYNENAVTARTSTDLVYTQIIKDLVEAKDALPEDYLTPERARANKFAAAALLAKVYLYRQDWANAEKYSDLVIQSGMYTLDNDLDNVFLRGSQEAILQLSSVQASVNTWEGNAILPASDQSSPTYLIRQELLNDFEPGDLRKLHWIQGRLFDGDSLFHPHKYKVFGNYEPITESYIMLRLADLFLIRSEARAKQSNLNGAAEDLNIIRTRAGLSNFNSANQDSMLAAIMHERRIEFFAEWGNRWYDLKRTGKADQVLGTLKPQTWQPTDVLWPIPQDQINQNPALKQNPGY